MFITHFSIDYLNREAIYCLSIIAGKYIPTPRKKKLSRVEILEKKRKAESLRYERLKNDPQKREEMREKERLKYIIKKEKGIRKLVKDMNPREHKSVKKAWREYSARNRAKKKSMYNKT
ncbi:unnamed protein product [Diatraea saccharalis]|uniref:Uncharacterized protein n=1 Tax=Diatraea saccharalis TaxID=40085 RepID=A0A9N9R124_9NEOP|nr:unnamed protein product [Diatraea saccharalis]